MSRLAINTTALERFQPVTFRPSQTSFAAESKPYTATLRDHICDGGAQHDARRHRTQKLYYRCLHSGCLIALCLFPGSSPTLGAAATAAAAVRPTSVFVATRQGSESGCPPHHAPSQDTVRRNLDRQQQATLRLTRSVATRVWATVSHCT